MGFLIHQWGIRSILLLMSVVLFRMPPIHCVVRFDVCVGRGAEIRPVFLMLWIQILIFFSFPHQNTLKESVRTLKHTSEKLPVRVLIFFS